MEGMFNVHPYSIDILKELLVKHSKTSRQDLESKSHSSYFESYFQDIKAKTIVVENEYVDHDFLEDHSGYYVRCFQDYHRKCTRFHFFSEQFDEDNFRNLLAGRESSISATTLQKSYLGFIVIKPLPVTIIGRTCLKTYPSNNGRRHYPITRPYQANLFGIPLEIKSLAFQEQDSVVAACATSALWSIFQGTGILFQHPIISPVEITKAATKQLAFKDRCFPNEGLTLDQMAHAVRKVGLEPTSIEVKDDIILKSTLYAFIQGKVPILLTVILVDMTDAKNPCRLGKHAIAVTGFNLGHNKVKPYKECGFLLRASRIDKIYSHDDQIGPFARMNFKKQTFPINGEECSSIVLSTSWKDAAGGTSNVIAIPEYLFIPLYHKIRIDFEPVHTSIINLDSILEEVRKEGELNFPQRIEWDIYLTTVNDLKNDIFRSKDVSTEERTKILLKSLPRFLWRATASIGNVPLLDLLFDATDIKQASFLIHAIPYHSGLFECLKEMSRMGQEKMKRVWKVLCWFSDNSI